MIAISNIRSKEDSISMSINIEHASFMENVPANFKLEPLKDMLKLFYRELSHLQVLVSQVETTAINYRKERADGINRLDELLSSIFIEIEGGVRSLKVSLDQKLFNQQLDQNHLDIESLKSHKNEYETLEAMKNRVNKFAAMTEALFLPKMKFYKALKEITQGEIKASITLKENYEFEFDIFDISNQGLASDNSEIARWKEFLAKELYPIIANTIEDYHSEKEVLKNLLINSFSPWDSYEYTMTVAEFLKARSQVVNFWNEKFSFSEILAHHFFKGCTFYKFFEQNILNGLNITKQKIDRRMRFLIENHSFNEQDVELYSNMKIRDFLKGDSLRLVNTDSLDKCKHRSFMMLKNTNGKLASEVWRQTELAIAKKLGGVVVSPGVIARENKAENRRSLRTELIVLSGQFSDKDPKGIIGGGFRDLMATKSENITEIAEIENKQQELTVEMDIKLSYFLSSNKLAA